MRRKKEKKRKEKTKTCNARRSENLGWLGEVVFGGTSSIGNLTSNENICKVDDEAVC